jgi:AraC-like DNA-binding protein/PAS domain-containing protein
MDQSRDHARGPHSRHPGPARTSAPTDLLAGHLLAGAPWDDRMDAGLEALGRLARADRVVLVSSARASAGSIVRAWSRESAGPSRRHELRSPDEVLVSRLDMLEEGKPVRIGASNASLLDEDPLGREGTPRILALPIFTSSGSWGYARIDRPSGSGWGDAEVEVLLDASRLLGWAVERWEAEIQLRKELERYRALVEEAPGLTYAHTDGEPKRILFMSARIEDVLGYPVEAWLREPGFPWKLLDPDDRNRLEALDALGAPPVVEYRMFARDGRMVRFCDATAPCYDSEGRVIHRGVLVDVTSLRDADEAMSDTGMERGSAASTIAAALLDAGPEPQLPPHVARLAEAASQYMREHLAERIDLPSLSSVLAVSPGHLGRLFKQRTGRTPHQFLIDLRLEAAEGLLADTDLTVTQIAWRVGFASPSHFVTTFRARRGSTPLEFRRRGR